MAGERKDGEVVALGTGGWIPTGVRETSSLVVALDDALIFFDTGTGLRRLLTDAPRRLLAAERPIYVLLSHFHIDHVVGVSFFSLLFRGRRVTVLGPGKEIGGQSTQEALSRLYGHPLYPTPLERFPLDLTVGDLHEGENKIGNHIVRVIRQKHGDPSVGLRLDADLCYMTDTACAEGTGDFARNASLLFHDCWLDRAGFQEVIRGGDRSALENHCDVDGVARLAQAANVGQLVLVHLNPAYDEARLERMLGEARQTYPNTVLGMDLQSFSLKETQGH